MSELNIKVRKSQDNGSTFRATPDTLYMGGVGSAKVDTLHFEVPEEWAGCAITLHVQRLSGGFVTGSPCRGAGKGGEKYGRDNCLHLIVHSVSFLLSYERVCSRLTYLDNLLIWIYLYLKCIR